VGGDRNTGRRQELCGQNPEEGGGPKTGKEALFRNWNKANKSTVKREDAHRVEKRGEKKVFGGIRSASHFMGVGTKDGRATADNYFVVPQVRGRGGNAKLNRFPPRRSLRSEGGRAPLASRKSEQTQ